MVYATVICDSRNFYILFIKKKDSQLYIKERVSKLLIPMISGVVFVVSVSVYFGFLYNGYTSGFLTMWWNFITNWFTYFAEGIGLGPLWFLLYLFIISLVALPIIIKYRNGEWRIPLEKVTVPKLLLLFIPLAIGNFFLNLYPEKSLVQFFLLFLFGYFFLSDDGIQEKLEDKRWPLFISFIGLMSIYLSFYIMNSAGGSAAPTASNISLVSILIPSLFTNFILWIGILGIMGMGKHYLEFKNSITLYLSAASFPIYIFHIAWINILAYYIIGFIPNMIVLQIILIMGISFVLTIVTIEIVRRINVIRSLFGIKG